MCIYFNAYTLFDGQAISCLGLRDVRLSVRHKILQMFFSEKNQVLRACSEDLDIEMAWPSLSLRVYLYKSTVYKNNEAEIWYQIFQKTEKMGKYSPITKERYVK